MFNPPRGTEKPAANQNRGHFGALRGGKLLVAFSGGKDSLALLHYVWTHRERMGWEITACHVNHNLRGAESRRDADFCRNWCSERGIPYIEAEVDVKHTPEASARGVEHAAREHRYKALEEARVKSGCACILTAHTRDDQLESFFVDLMTGASIFTLGGIEAVNGRLVRPVLNVSTEEIAEYLERNGLSPVYDSSNDDPRYVRNLVRRTLIPAVKSLDSGIMDSIGRVQAESATLRGWMDERTAKAVTHMPEGGVAIDRKLLDSFSAPERMYAIGKWLSFLCRGGRAHTGAVMEQLSRPRSVRHNLPEGWLCEVAPRTVRIFPAVSVAPFCVDKAERTESAELPDGRLVKFPPDMIDTAFRVRSRKNGDRYGGKKLKDMFEKRGVEPYGRDRALVIESGGEIVWVEYLPDTQKMKIEVAAYTSDTPD